MAPNICIEPIQFKTTSGICGFEKIFFPKISHVLQDGIPTLYGDLTGIKFTDGDSIDDARITVHKSALKILLKTLMKDSNYNTFDVVITFQDIVGNK